MSDSDYNSDNDDSDSSFFDDYPDTPAKKNDIKINTNGTSIKLPNLTQCECCQKYFSENMINMDDGDFIKCHHCTYRFKYDDFQKPYVPDSNIETMLEYIKLCKNDHPPSSQCFNITSGSNCMLCEAKFGSLPDCVEGYEMRLQKKRKSEADQKIYVDLCLMQTNPVTLHIKYMDKETNTKIVV